MAELQLSVFGLLGDVAFQQAKCCVEDLYDQNAVEKRPIVCGMLEFEWNSFVDQKKKELKGEMWVFDDTAMVFADDVLVGSPMEFLMWAKRKYQYGDFRPRALYVTLAEEAYKSHMLSTNHDYVFMDISIGDKQCGRLVIELFTDKVPKTCQNFARLCSGMGESRDTGFQLSYKGSIFHRIMPNGWIQGGDTWLKKGDGGESIYGLTFEDENFSVSHDRRGILGMANKGRHSNGSQFYITLQPTKWMDTMFVAFGKVIEGTETLKAMENVSTDNERPTTTITITNCGPQQYDF